MKRITLFITLLLLISISAIAQTVYKAGERKTTFANGDKVIIYSTCNKGTHDAIITRDNTSGQRTDSGVEVAVPNSDYLSFGNSVWIIEIIEEHEGEPVVAFKRINDNKYWGIGGATGNDTADNPQKFYLKSYKNWGDANAAIISGVTPAVWPNTDVTGQDLNFNSVNKEAIKADSNGFGLYAVVAKTGKPLNTLDRTYNTSGNAAYPIAFYEAIELSQEEIESIESEYTTAATTFGNIMQEIGFEPIRLQTTNEEAPGYLSSNAPDSSEGSIHFLIDGITGVRGNHFHSDWHTPDNYDTDDNPNGKHYLQVDLGESHSLKEFIFSFQTRSDAQQDYPEKIIVSGSNDNINFTTFKTTDATGNETNLVSTNLTATSNINKLFVSPILKSETAYRYIRISVEETTNGDKKFFHMAEFGIADVSNLSNIYKNTIDYFVTECIPYVATYSDIIAQNKHKNRIKASGVNKLVLIKLTTDDNNPICYLIKSGRTEEKGSGKWYWKRNTSNDGSFKVVDINNNAENDIEAYWYFKEVDNSIQLIPYTTQRPMAYTEKNEAENKINENGTGGSSFSLKIETSDQQANFPYALIAYTKNDTNNTPVYISNHGGTNNNMGLHNGLSDWGTRFTIEPVTNNTKINYPEDGKAYYIKALYANDGHRYFYRNDAGKLQVSATKKDVFVFRDLGNNKYAVVNNYGEYLVYYADGKQGVGSTNDGFANTYEQGTNDAEVTFIPAKNTKVTNTGGGSSTYDVRRLGHFLIQAKMNNGTDYYMMGGGVNATSDGGDFHNGGATDIYFTDTRSSLFELEEVEYPNTPVLTTLNEGITAATFSSPFPTIAPEGVTAHKVTISGNYAVLTELEGAIPANTGVILTSENAGKVTMLPAASEAIATNAENNALEHSAGNEKDMTNIENAYILTLNGFNPCSGGTLGMNKSYLVVPTAMQSNSLSLRFDDGFTTGVENVDIENAPEVIYTIGGIRVNSATLPGLYIVNGKKVYVK